jgi:site-specific recombinase XerD
MPKKPKHQKVCEHFVWSLFRRGETYYADGRGNTPSLGKHSLGVTDYDQAIEELRRLDRRMAAKCNLIELVPEQQEVSIAEGWNAFDRHTARPDVLGGAGSKTQARYRAVRQKHEAFCAEEFVRSWNQVDKKHVLDYGTHLKCCDYSDATIYLESTTLKQVVKFLIEEEHRLPESSRIRLHLRRSHQSDTFCPGRNHFQTMLEHYRKTSGLGWMGDVITALGTTGMRIGELCGLRWSDVDLNTNMITIPDNRHSGRHQQQGAVRTTKGRRTRRVPIHPVLRVRLAVMRHHVDGRVFHGPRGGVLKSDTVLAVLKREIIKPLEPQFPTPKGEIGFAHCRVHSFRHFFVSQAFLGGASEGEIREWVGHTDSRIIERYRHLAQDDAKRKMNGLTFFDEGAIGQQETSDGNSTGGKNNGGGANLAGVADEQSETGSTGPSNNGSTVSRRTRAFRFPPDPIQLRGVRRR